MKVILFGATGMVGQGALRECLLDPGVEEVLAIVRRPLEQKDPKLRELVVQDLTDYSKVGDAIAGYDACFFCLGVTSSGMTEADYRKVTVDIAVAAARALVAKNPGMTFVFVSGTGADSSGTSKTMWARVKGEAENAILALPFKAAFALRPAFIKPLHGIRSRTRAYNVLYFFLRPLVPLVELLFPRSVTSTELVGQAMLSLARRGAPKRVLENADINEVAKAAAG